MTYLRALQLLTKAYKAAKGRLPEGLDLLKVKQKARQKAIDSNKVIDAAAKFDKGNWFRLNKKPAKAGFGKPKKVETEAEMLARMKKQNKEAVQRLKEKKKPREDKATGGLTNISETYDANPTLQAQFPNFYLLDQIFLVQIPFLHLVLIHSHQNHYLQLQWQL